MVRLNPRSFRVMNQDGASNMMHPVEGGDHVGAYLREARETTGRTVADVAQILRIRRVYLEAIEDGRFDELPGATYAVGFVRSYAAYLRLDTPTLVARFKEEASGIEAPQDLDFPTPVPEGRFPGGLLVTLSLVLGAAVFGGWYWFQSQSGIEVARVPAPPGNVLTNTAASPPAPDATVPVVATALAPTAAAPTSAAPTAVVPDAPNAAPDPVVSDGAPVVAVESVVATAVPTISAPDDSAPVMEESGVPLVPPSYLQPQADPLASMVDVPTLAGTSADAPPADPVVETMGVAETPAPDVARETVVGEASPAETATSDATAANPTAAVAPAGVTPASVKPADVVASATTPADNGPKEEPAAVTEVAVATPEPAEFSSEPAIIALPEVEDSQTISSANAPDREGRTFGARNAAARIILNAQENTWVQVRDGDENVILTQMLRAGDRYLVPDRAGLRLMTGNAGGLEISVDGGSVPAIGERGESRRDVRLDPDLLKTGAAVAR